MHDLDRAQYVAIVLGEHERLVIACAVTCNDVDSINSCSLSVPIRSLVWKKDTENRKEAKLNDESEP
ncbi:hypothetical protein BDZ89DRAFT_1069622 [Hymenopellis radicata]|nr:hypothetical protein BDZ89DRAFT_1069622 [Hymenopellis radicata]